MTDALYASMALPDSCHLGKRVFKKLFSENASFTAADKRAFADDIENVTWQYTLKPSTVPISAYEDDEREYHEVAVIQVNLKTDKRTKRIAEVIHRAIPYPVLLVLSLPPAFAVSVAHKRFSRAERDAIVAEGVRLSGWMEPDALSAEQAGFIESLALPGLPHTHFFDLYSALVDRVAALDASLLTGSFTLLTSGEEQAERLKRLAECRSIEQHISEQRALLKNETHFNRQLELNTIIKRLESRLRTESSRL